MSVKVVISNTNTDMNSNIQSVKTFQYILEMEDIQVEMIVCLSP